MSPDRVPADVPVILIPEVRDYVRINTEIIGLLDQGRTIIRLEGAEGQRLLASGLVGSWDATIEIMGRTGPELAANLDAPGLRIIARGSTLDGAGRGLRAGMLLILGDGGDGLGAAQVGGTLVVTGNSGHRAGLNQAGGTLAVLGLTGRLAGDRQTGGWFFLGKPGASAHAGRGQRGGHRVGWSDPLDGEGAAAWSDLIARTQPWIEPATLVRLNREDSRDQR